jgi:hypothetical protein
VATLAPIRINGEAYPCNEWRTEQSGRVIREDWEDGWLGGMGELNRKSPNRYYVSNGFDASTYPYLRLRPQIDASIPLSGFGANVNHGAFGFVEQGTGGTNYMYVLNGRYSWKLDIDTPNFIVRKDHQDVGPVATCGRPAFFEGSWLVPLGVLHDADFLQNVAEGGSDTWTTLGATASHFANYQDGAVAKVARVTSVGGHNCQVSLSGNGTVWADDFEVGESTLVAADMLTLQGELMIVRDDNLYRFTGDAVASEIVGFVGRQASNKSARANFDGVNSGQHGPYTFWVHSTGLWRIVGNAADDIGPESNPEWTNLTLDGFTGFSSGSWQSFAAWGRWAYATFFDSLYFGRIQNDGSILWHGVLFRQGSSVLRVIIEENGPNLWVTDATNAQIHKMSLDQDGSPKGTMGSKRGADSTKFQIWMARINGGSGSLRELVQWRFMWIELENWTSTAPVQLGFHKDGSSTFTSLGSTVSTEGRNVVSWTPGTDDIAYEIQPSIKITTSGYSPSSSDPRIRGFGVEGVTAQVYRVSVPLTAQELVSAPGNLGIPGSLKALRALRAAAPVSIQEPGMNDTFTGYVRDIEEQALPDGEWLLTLRIERWDWRTDS